MTTATRKKGREQLTPPPFGLIVEDGEPVRATTLVADFRTLLVSAGLDTVAFDNAVNAFVLSNQYDEATDDVAAYEEAKAEGGERIPSDVIDRLIDGDNPIKVFRVWRGYSQKGLAKAIGSSPAYVSQLETGARNASNAKLRAIADTLGIDFALLVDWYTR